MYLSYFAFSFYNFLLFFFLFSYVSHIFFHPFSAHKDASRSRQELSNEYLVAKIGVDTAENDALQLWLRDSSDQTKSVTSVARRVRR